MTPIKSYNQIPKYVCKSRPSSCQVRFFLLTPRELSHHRQNQHHSVPSNTPDVSSLLAQKSVSEKVKTTKNISIDKVLDGLGAPNTKDFTDMQNRSKEML